MAFWSRRTILILLASLILISVIARYPLVEHERYQSDSYFIHHLADTVATEEYASWTYHPLSYVGYYPLSYPSGVPFLLAEFAVMSGLSVDVSIIVLNIVFATIFCLAAFLLARHFIVSVEYALLATFFAILGSRFVDTSYWNASARAPVVALLLLAAMILLDPKITVRMRKVAVGALIGVGCFAIHHMAILLILFGIAYIVTVFETDFLFRHSRAYGRKAVAAVAFLSAALIIATPFLLFDYFWESAVRGFQDSSLFSFDSTLLTVFMTAATSYANQIGFVLLFAAAYVPILVRRSKFTHRAIFPVVVIVVFLPIFGETLYLSMLLSPFVAVLGSLWFLNAFNRSRNRLRVAAILMILMMASIALPFWSTDRWNSETFASGDRVLVENQIFNDAYYMMTNTDSDIATCNVIPIRARLEALSRVDFMNSGITLVLNGDVTGEEVKEEISKSNVAFPKNIYNWFEYENEPLVNSYVRDLMILGTPYLYSPFGIGYGVDYFAKHSKLTIVIDNRWSSEYLTTRSVYSANLPGELQMSTSLLQESGYEGAVDFSSYAFYRSNLLTVYLVQLPQE